MQPGLGYHSRVTHMSFDPKLSNPKLRELILEARAGKIGLAEFQDRLDSFDLGGVRRMYCLRDAFGLEFGEAKGIQIIRDYGSAEAWAKDLIGAIDEIDAESEDYRDETAADVSGQV